MRGPQPAPSRSAHAAPSTAAPRPTTATAGPTGSELTTEIWGDNAVPFRTPTTADYAGAALTRHSSGSGTDAVGLTVPASWVFEDESIPSDHNDWIYYDPANPAARFEFTGSGCIGCLHTHVTDTSPVDPTRVAPSGATHVVAIDDGKAAAFSEPPDDGYAVDGVVRIDGTLAAPRGSAVFRVALPPADHALATLILDSVRVG